MRHAPLCIALGAAVLVAGPAAAEGLVRQGAAAAGGAAGTVAGATVGGPVGGAVGGVVGGAIGKSTVGLVGAIIPGGGKKKKQRKAEAEAQARAQAQGPAAAPAQVEPPLIPLEAHDASATVAASEEEAPAEAAIPAD